MSKRRKSPSKCKSRSGRESRAERTYPAVPVVTTAHVNPVEYEELPETIRLALGGLTYKEHLEAGEAVAGPARARGQEVLVLPIKLDVLMCESDDFGGETPEGAAAALEAVLEDVAPIEWDSEIQAAGFILTAMEEWQSADEFLAAAVEDEFDNPLPPLETVLQVQLLVDAVPEFVYGEISAYWMGEEVIAEFSAEDTGVIAAGALALALRSRGRIVMGQAVGEVSPLFGHRPARVVAWEVRDGALHPLPAAEVTLEDMRVAPALAAAGDAPSVQVPPSM